MSITSGVPEPGGDRGAAQRRTERSALRWRRVFPGAEDQIGAMRRWLASLLPDSPTRDDVVLVASELAGNALRHTASGRGGWFAVEITRWGSMVQVAVADQGGSAQPHVIEDLMAEHGRGLMLVRGLAARMGYCGDERGRLVWARILWDEPADTAEPVAGDWYEDAISDGEAALASRFVGVPAWFGRATLQWWALGPAGLVTAPSARELGELLNRLRNSRAWRQAHRAEAVHVWRGLRPGRFRHRYVPVLVTAGQS